MRGPVLVSTRSKTEQDQPKALKQPNLFESTITIWDQSHAIGYIDRTL